jgi:transposase
MTESELARPLQPRPEDTRTLEELRKENEYLRVEVAYLKKLNALVRANRQAAQKRRKP